MIEDNELYRLAIFLGSAAMFMIVLYHFLEVNGSEGTEADSKPIAVDSQFEGKLKSVGGK